MAEDPVVRITDGAAPGASAVQAGVARSFLAQKSIAVDGRLYIAHIDHDRVGLVADLTAAINGYGANVMAASQITLGDVCVTVLVVSASNAADQLGLIASLSEGRLVAATDPETNGSLFLRISGGGPRRTDTSTINFSVEATDLAASRSGKSAIGWQRVIQRLLQDSIEIRTLELGYEGGFRTTSATARATLAVPQEISRADLALLWHDDDDVVIHYDISSRSGSPFPDRGRWLTCNRIDAFLASDATALARVVIEQCVERGERPLNAHITTFEGHAIAIFGFRDINFAGLDESAFHNLSIGDGEPVDHVSIVTTGHTPRDAIVVRGRQVFVEVEFVERPGVIADCSRLFATFLLSIDSMMARVETADNGSLICRSTFTLSATAPAVQIDLGGLELELMRLPGRRQVSVLRASDAEWLESPSASRPLRLEVLQGVALVEQRLHVAVLLHSEAAEDDQPAVLSFQIWNGPLRAGEHTQAVVLDQPTEIRIPFAPTLIGEPQQATLVASIDGRTLWASQVSAIDPT